MRWYKASKIGGTTNRRLILYLVLMRLGWGDYLWMSATKPPGEKLGWMTTALPSLI